MKKDIHPPYNYVVFRDTNSDLQFLTRSTLTAKDTIKWEDGKTYPLVNLEVSAASHPFFTGKRVLLDSSGKVEKFRKKYNLKK